MNADCIEAVDLDHILGADEVKVLAASGLSALSPSDPLNFDGAPVDDDLIARTNSAGDCDLGGPMRGELFSHAHSLLKPIGCSQSGSVVWCIASALEGLVHAFATLNEGAWAYRGHTEALMLEVRIDGGPVGIDHPEPTSRSRLCAPEDRRLMAPVECD